MDTAKIENVEFDAVIEKEQLSTGEDIYVASCVHVAIASQGSTIEEATDNLTAALKLWMETASQEEVEANIPELRRDNRHVYRTRIEVPYGQVASAVGR